MNTASFALRIARGASSRVAPAADWEDEELADVQSTVISALNGEGYLVDIEAL